jgi:hypothetical protein
MDLFTMLIGLIALACWISVIILNVRCRRIESGININGHAIQLINIPPFGPHYEVGDTERIFKTLKKAKYL